MPPPGSVKDVFFNYEYLFRPLEESRLSLSRDMGFQEVLLPERRVALAVHGLRRQHRIDTLPAAPPGPLLREKEADHLLCWDSAHLAPFGPELLACILEPAVERLVRARLGFVSP